MKKTVTIHCYARQEAPGTWVALCLNFDLAAQGETFDEAKARLDAMLNEYVADALTGADQDQADAFLNRRAPWYYWLRYWAYVALARLRPRRSPRPFVEELPLALAR
jgi:predicted RNase H-like HicB family nuclease